MPRGPFANADGLRAFHNTSIMPHTTLLTSVKYSAIARGSTVLGLPGTFPEEVRIVFVLLVRCSGFLLPMIGAHTTDGSGFRL